MVDSYDFILDKLFFYIIIIIFVAVFISLSFIKKKSDFKVLTLGLPKSVIIFVLLLITALFFMKYHMSKNEGNVGLGGGLGTP